MLSLCFRSLAAAKGAPTVSSTAAATIRQAVAICFDHAVIPVSDGTSQSPGGAAAASGAGRRLSGAGGRVGVDAVIAGAASGRQRAALKLLNDLCVMCEGGPCRRRVPGS